MSDTTETFAVELGRRAPFSQLGDWVVLSGATAPACKLYWILSMHINVKRGDREVWPPRATLAELMGYARAKAIDPYVVELEDLGAITVRRAPKVKGVAQGASTYIVHQEPPEGYTGLRSNADFYRAKKDVPPAQTRVPSEGHPVSPVRDTPRVPSRGHPVSPGGDTNKTEVNKNNSLPPTEVERRAHDVRARANTPETATVSRDSSETLPGDAKIPTQPVSNRRVRQFLPDGWEPSARLLEWAAAELPGLDVGWETTDFVAYWSSHASKAKGTPDWDRAWQNWMRKQWTWLGLDRRAAKAAEAEVDLFTVDVAGLTETANEIADAWADWWHANRGPVLPSVRTNLRKLLLEALQGGATADQVKQALKLRNEPCPWPKEFTAALAGQDTRAPAGGMTYRERDKHNEDMASAQGWKRVAERVAAGTENDPKESMRVIIQSSMDRAAKLLAEEQDSTPGPAPSALAILRGEIAQ